MGGDKMTEQKDWSLPPHKNTEITTPAEQLSTKKDWNLSKDTLHPKTKKKKVTMRCSSKDKPGRNSQYEQTNHKY